MISTLNFGDAPEAALSSTDPEQLYTREKKFLDERRVLPMVALPDYTGIGHQAKNITEANLTDRMAIALSRRNADQSLYVRDAVGSAQADGLDYVEFANYDGVLISSAQFPARVGHKNDWVTSVKDWNDTPAFLKKEELPDGVSLSLSVVRTNTTVADKSLYIIGGHRLDKNLLASLVLPTWMRALIYTNLDPTFTATSLMAEKIDAE